VFSRDAAIWDALTRLPAVNVVGANSVAGAASKAAPGDFVLADLDVSSPDQIARACVYPGVEVIAVASCGHDGLTLEYTLLQAELRGAVAALPKPISAADISETITRLRQSHQRMERSRRAAA